MAAAEPGEEGSQRRAEPPRRPRALRSRDPAARALYRAEGDGPGGGGGGRDAMAAHAPRAIDQTGETGSDGEGRRGKHPGPASRDQRGRGRHVRRGAGRSRAGRGGSARTSLPALPRLRGARGVGEAEGGSVTPSLCHCPLCGTALRLGGIARMSLHLACMSLSLAALVELLSGSAGRRGSSPSRHGAAMAASAQAPSFSLRCCGGWWQSRRCPASPALCGSPRAFVLPARRGSPRRDHPVPGRSWRMGRLRAASPGSSPAPQPSAGQ